MRDGGDMEDGIRLGQGVIAGVVAERALVAQRFARVNIAYDDEAGLPADGSAQAGIGNASVLCGSEYARA